MKGIILAGGTGSRLYPLTKVTNKHLLPVYNKPMIYYPIETLRQAGIANILVVSGKGHAGHFLELLGSGKEFGVRFSYEVQEEAGGIAQALSLAEDFADGEKTVVILGDNIIQDDISQAVADFKRQTEGAKVFLKEVPNPSSYGIAEVADEKLVRIVEKPKQPPTNLAVVGLYMYDGSVFEVIRSLRPSARGEYEITDVNNYYIERGVMSYEILQNPWGDAGESFHSYLQASLLVAQQESGKEGS